MELCSKYQTLVIMAFGWGGGRFGLNFIVSSSPKVMNKFVVCSITSGVV